MVGKQFFSTGTVLLGLIASVAAHGLIKIPNRRRGGDKMREVCGFGPWDYHDYDAYGPIENMVKEIGSDYTSECDLYFCKGLRWEDNSGTYYKYQVGQSVNMQTDIVAHHKGYTNVSILSTETKKIIAGPLISWKYWGFGVDPTEKNFNITIPDLGTQCIEPGKCVIQWWWYSPKGNPEYPNGNNQTYESCIDFVTVPGPSVSSSISNPASSSTKSSSSSAKPSSSSTKYSSTRTRSSTTSSKTSTSTSRSSTTKSSSTTTWSSTTSSGASSSAVTTSSEAVAPIWGQCGGREWLGPTKCPPGYVCTVLNEWQHQCLRPT